MLPCTTKRRITTNLKTRNNQNYQKIKLHGTPTTEEIKKRSYRWVGGAETGSRAERASGKEADHVDKAEAGGLGTPIFIHG